MNNNLQFDTYGGSNSVWENIGDTASKVWDDITKPFKSVHNFVTGGQDPLAAQKTITGKNTTDIMFKDPIKGIEKNKTADTQGEQSTGTEEKNASQELEDMLSLAEKQEQKELEERRHAEEREDTAYQRAIADMRKAGWNTDGLQPQASASSARLDSSRSEGAKDRAEQEKDRKLKLKMLYKELDQAVKENKKDRVLSIVQSIMSLGGTITGANILSSARKK